METKLDLDYWMNTINQTLQNIVIQTKEVTFRMWKSFFFLLINQIVFVFF